MVIANIRRNAPDADILVVNDGSCDQTAQIARAAGAVVVSHPFNLGYGAAIQTGYKYAAAKGYAYVAQIDGDGQHDPAYLPRLLAPVIAGQADVVIGSRFSEPTSYTPPLMRRIGMNFFRTIVSSILGVPITDSTSGYQAFNRDVIRFFTTDVFPCDYPDADVLIALHLAGFRIREEPVRMFANSAQKSMHSGLKPLYYVFKMLLSIGVTLLRDHAIYRRKISCP